MASQQATFAPFARVPHCLEEQVSCMRGFQRALDEIAKEARQWACWPRDGLPERRSIRSCAPVWSSSPRRRPERVRNVLDAESSNASPHRAYQILPGMGGFAPQSDTRHCHRLVRVLATLLSGHARPAIGAHSHDVWGVMTRTSSGSDLQQVERLSDDEVRRKELVIEGSSLSRRTHRPAAS